MLKNKIFLNKSIIVNKPQCLPITTLSRFDASHFAWSITVIMEEITGTKETSKGKTQQEK